MDPANQLISAPNGRGREPALITAAAAGQTCRLPCAAWAPAGVYLPSSDPGQSAHELTQRIRASKVSRRHEGELADLLAAALQASLAGYSPELVASIPHRPGGEDRFANIQRLLATRSGASDGQAALSQTRVVEGYREMAASERRARCPGRFAADERVRGTDVLLIDDVITTGAQATEAIRALTAAGAGTVAFLAIAVATRAPAAAPGVAEPGARRLVE